MRDMIKQLGLRWVDHENEDWADPVWMPGRSSTELEGYVVVSWAGHDIVALPSPYMYRDEDDRIATTLREYVDGRLQFDRTKAAEYLKDVERLEGV